MLGTFLKLLSYVADEILYTLLNLTISNLCEILANVETKIIGPPSSSLQPRAREAAPSSLSPTAAVGIHEGAGVQEQEAQEAQQRIGKIELVPVKDREKNPTPLRKLCVI